MEDYRTEKIDVTLAWGFVAQSILALLDFNTNIKSEDREHVRSLLVDMSRVADTSVDACKLLKETLVHSIVQARGVWTEEDMLENGYKNTGDMVIDLESKTIPELTAILQEDK